MQTENLETVSIRVAKTLKEVVNDREVYYQYETNEANIPPIYVDFSIQGNEKRISGNYAKEGGILNFNGGGLTSVEDLVIFQKAFATILEIVKGD